MSYNEELKIACRAWGARAAVQARPGPTAADVLIDIGDAARAAESRGIAQCEDTAVAQLTDLLLVDPSWARGSAVGHRVRRHG